MKINNSFGISDITQDSIFTSFGNTDFHVELKYTQYSQFLSLG